MRGTLVVDDVMSVVAVEGARWVWMNSLADLVPQMDHPAALHRIQVGVPATVEHSSEAGPETGKWVAETTQVGD